MMYGEMRTRSAVMTHQAKVIAFSSLLKYSRFTQSSKRIDLAYRATADIIALLLIAPASSISPGGSDTCLSDATESMARSSSDVESPRTAKKKAWPNCSPSSLSFARSRRSSNGRSILRTFSSSSVHEETIALHHACVKPTCVDRKSKRMHSHQH